MRQVPGLVEIHFALWGVLAVPFGFAGLVFCVPGLMFSDGIPLLAVSALLVIYVTRLSRGDRLAWLAGVFAHAALVIGALYYIPRWPDLLAIPLAAANVYSLLVLLRHRGLWRRAAQEPAVQTA